jgi:hypothetical protein
MKKYLLILSSIIIILNSCELQESDPDTDPGTINQDTGKPEVILTIGDNISFDYSDIELYDSSSHILYFRDNHPEFDKIKNSSFVFYAEGDTIYDGSFWPGYFSSLPAGPYISNSPFFYKNYALRIEFRESNTPDPRNDPRLMESLKDRDLLHSGLLVRISSLEISGSLSRLSFSVTNMDKSSLLILDPDKMGHKLFHYFTNGLYLKDLASDSIIPSVLESQTPVPWNGWSMDWLTTLNPGESRRFTLNYSFEKDINPGDYLAWFEYPGLSYQIAIEELNQNSGRIWLGDIEALTGVTVR